MRTWFLYGLAMMAAGVPVRAVVAQGTEHWDTGRADDCRDHWFNDDDATYCEVRITRLGRVAGPISVDAGEHGGIEIQGTDGDSVVVRSIVRAMAATDDAARALAGQVRVVTDGRHLHAEGPAERHRMWWVVSYRIAVPRRADLTLETVNGPVSVDRVNGQMDLRAENGPVTLDRIGGDVHARSENGPIDVALIGPRWDGAGLDAETENGPVTLTLPSTYAAHLETGSETGPMSIHFPITVQGRIDSRHLALDIGGGGPPVRIVTTNGPVVVKRGGS